MIFIRETLQCDAGNPDPAALCARLAPGVWAVEACAHPPPSHDPAGLLGDEAVGAMALSLSSTTALGLCLGPALVDRLAAFGLFPGPLAGLALHELIINAVIHGNLHVASGRAQRWQDTLDRQTLIARSITNPLRAALVVTIALSWRVSQLVAVIADQGDGYDAKGMFLSGRGAGRGLRLARMVGSVEVLRDGRQTSITIDSVPTATGDGS